MENQEPVNLEQPVVSNSKSIIYVVVGVIAILVIGGGIYYYLNSNKSAENLKSTDLNTKVEIKDQEIVNIQEPIAVNNPVEVKNETKVETTAPVVENAEKVLSGDEMDISGIVNSIKKMKDIVSKKDVTLFLDSQSIFYDPKGTDLADLKEQIEGKMANNIWQTYNDIYNNINYDSLNKDLQNCKFYEKQPNKSYDRAAVCNVTLMIPKMVGNNDPVADGSTYNLKIKLTKKTDVWYMLAPTIFDLENI